MKNKIRSVFLCAVLFFQMIGIFAFSTNQSESMLFSEIRAAYQSKFYPGAINHASDFEKSFPQSQFLGHVLLIYGESLYHVNRLTQAKETLEKAAVLNQKDKNLFLQSSYWLGRTLFDLQKYDEACKNFYNASEKSSENDFIYLSSVLFAGRSFVAIKDYEKSIPLLEYVVENGNLFSQNDFDEVILLLMDSYVHTENFNKIVDVYHQLENEKTSVWEKITFYAGDAYYSLKDYKTSYSLYEKILLNGDSRFAVLALQKSYAVSAEHQSDVKKEPGEVLALVKEKLEGNPELLDEFWLRLGIDSFKSKKYEKAKGYLNYISEDAPLFYKLSKNLYEAEFVLLNEKGSVKESAKKTQKMLSDALAKAGNLSEINPDLFNLYQNRLLHCAVLQENWGEALLFSEKIQTFDEDSLYWKSLSEYYSGSASKALETLKTSINNKPVWQSNLKTRAFFAICLAKNNFLNDSLKVSENLLSDLPLKSKLPEDVLFIENFRKNYANVLISVNKNNEAIQQAEQCTSTEALYICALANYNLGKWQNARDYFEKYLTNEKNNSEYKNYAQFYLGYAFYRTGDYNSAYKTFYLFAKQNESDSHAWSAYVSAADSAVALEKLNWAKDAALAAVNISRSEEEKQKSVLLCSGIYSDLKQYSDALALLLPFAQKKNAFALQCRYEAARVYEKNKDLNKADDLYASIVADFPNEDLAEESEYRRGEIFYSAKNYSIAIERFDSYIKKYPEGKFFEAAMYFGAEAYGNSGMTNRAILRYELLLNSEKSKTYRYASLKNLCELNKSQGDYVQALAQAKKMKAEFTKQALEENIDQKINELEQLVSGTDARIVQKKSEYERFGGKSTVEGRNIGTELAQLYESNPETYEEGATLAEILFVEQKKNLSAESLSAAKNAFLLGTIYRKQNRNEQSAKMFLSAAEYFRMNAFDSEAANALYGAVEAFDAAVLYGDSKEAAETLKKLYPDSRQNSAAQQIINRN